MQESLLEDTLDNLTTLIIDNRSRTPKLFNSDWSESGYPVISAKNIKNGRLVNEHKIRFIDDELFKQWMTDKVDADDVIVTTEGPLGELYYFKDKSNYCLGQRLIGIRTDKEKLHGRYLYYFLNTKKGQHELHSRSSGTTVLGIRQSELRRINVTFVKDIKKQQEITKFLGSLDDKIMINQKINKTLGMISNILFDLLFTHNPDKKTERLGDHTIIKGRIGWKGLKTSEYVDDGCLIVGGKQLINDRVNWNSCPRVTQERYDESPDIQLKKGDILMTKDGTIGKLAYVDELPEPATVASGIFVIRSDSSKIDQMFLLQCFKSNNFKKLVENRIEGSVLPHLYQRDLKDLEITIPSDKSFEMFSKFAEVMTLKTYHNLKLNDMLQEMLDIITPKLLEGKITLITK